MMLAHNGRLSLRGREANPTHIKVHFLLLSFGTAPPEIFLVVSEKSVTVL